MTVWKETTHAHLRRYVHRLDRVKWRWGGLLPTREGETTSEALIVVVYHDTVRDSRERITTTPRVVALMELAEGCTNRDSKG